ncbi:MAG: hypothetical protein KAS71_15670, partial [Bacteroidales bacterium]|nr:hypothetical protein [Bacteroidales bacterium]
MRILKKWQLPISLMLLIFMGSVGCRNEKDKDFRELDIVAFRNPPAESRPFVRWWWNGNQVTKHEITRQLDVLQKAGIGGVEINPIAMPGEAVKTADKPLTWLSREWNETFAFAATEAKSRGLITDMIVGSGWPFGGEFLKEDETIQRVSVHTIRYNKGAHISETAGSLIDKALRTTPQHTVNSQNAGSEILFVTLLPEGSASLTDITDLTEVLFQKKVLNIEVNDGPGLLVYGVLQRGHRQVLHGAPGAAGPVLNHYDREVTKAYLKRLIKLSEDTGMSLSEMIRALFCDSIELSGANWTDGFQEIFYERYHYRLEPYYPFVFYGQENAYALDEPADYMKDQVKRVRYDFNKLLVEVFLTNFTRTFKEFCSENGLLCRYQAYGTPFLMGMMEGNMIPDIPEGNTWLFTNNMEDENWNWNQSHGYMIWNLYAASGGHLTGKKIISSESMTNTRGVFRLTLEDIKLHDDMNFITGINHTVLHGYNYSPKEAGFPGWIRYGAYFSEQNTWWPYFPKWVDYNARLSYVFQNSRAVKSIAILGPTGDIWSNYGLSRDPFHTEPWYCYRIWEPISQAGSSCDYISEKIIQSATIGKGTLNYGNMSYKAVMLTSVKSLEPSTAKKIREFVKSGGKILMIDEIPERSLSVNNAEQNDGIIQDIFKDILRAYPDQCLVSDSPFSEEDLLPWTCKLIERAGIEKDVDLHPVYNHIYQIHKKSGNQEIYFFVNANKTKEVSFEASFPTGNKVPYIWNPEKGTRSVFPYESKKNL